MRGKAKVIGTGSYLLGPVITNQQLSEHLGRWSIRHALLIGGELISLFSALFDSAAAWDREYKSYLVGLAMFGNGAGALVLGPTQRDEVGVIGSMFRSMGSGRDPGMLLRAGDAFAVGAAGGTPDGGVFF